ncbi:MAG TPA: methyltransferase domain-containing protein [Pyrinomonadaceae bacterium]|nr:methyltransferase domain-containing protein [Pyrinomonadaceae bacterium]
MTQARPGGGLKTQKMPGHWVLARMGKRVLRPGGMGLTRRMLASLNVGESDDVVEFAPGMGITARLTLALRPASYTAVERDEAAAKIVENYLTGSRQRCVLGSAAETGLPGGSATVVYGEAMLTMQTEEAKRHIVREAARLLRPGGSYAIHEMCLRDGVGGEVRMEVERALTGVVHHGVRPLTVSEWRLLLEGEGFKVKTSETAPMALLEPARVISDEGFFRAIRFAFNVLRDAEARRRVFEMRRVFRRHRGRLAAVTITAVRA